MPDPLSPYAPTLIAYRAHADYRLISCRLTPLWPVEEASSRMVGHSEVETPTGVKLSTYGFARHPLEVANHKASSQTLRDGIAVPMRPGVCPLSGI